MVAEGAAHVYPRLAPTSEWDTCAAQAIVECAGGEVLQFAGERCDAGKPVVYGKEHPLNPFFVVYGKRETRKAPQRRRIARRREWRERARRGCGVLGLGALAFLALS